MSHPASDCDEADRACESRPLLPQRKDVSVEKFWVGALVTALVASWCIVDSWQRTTGAELFAVADATKLTIDRKTGDLNLDSHSVFHFPLTLALIQFAFMGLLFTTLWAVSAANPSADLAGIKGSIWDMRWPVLVVTHIFSTFWLSALMLPTQMMSLPAFAASRAVEVPAAAVLRAQAFGSRLGGHTLTTCALMFASAWILFYSYAQIAQCLCIWSGHGVALTGPALYTVYALVLLIPVANAVCQETVMVHLEIPPLLLLAVQNCGACLCFSFFLLAAHFTGLEDVHLAAQVIMETKEVTMLIVWLCVQMGVISAVGVGLIYVVDSFWGVALRSMRVVWWWVKELILFYFFSDSLLSIANPRASLWSFVMFCGLILGVVSLLMDRKADDDRTPQFAAIAGKQTSLWKAV